MSCWVAQPDAMTEPAPAVPHRARRPILHIALGLGLALVVAGIGLVWFVRRPEGPFRCTFEGFEKSVDGTSIVAVITFTNWSNRTYSFAILDGGTLCESQFFATNFYDGGQPWRMPRMTRGHTIRDYGPKSVARLTVPLPQDGRVGRISLWMGQRSRPAAGWLTRLRTRLGAKGLQSGTEFSTMFDEVIQCPRARPDGTTEPPGVMMKWGQQGH